MHLTDQQLLENNQEDRFHLEQCDLCQARKNRALQLQAKLAELPCLKAPESSWEKLDALFDAQQGTSPSSNKLVPFKSKSKATWTKKYYAIAASTVFTVALAGMLSKQFIMGPSLLEEQLEVVIAENTLIQQQLSNKKFDVNHDSADLVAIDSQLQSSYQLELDNEAKLALWKQRLELLKATASTMAEATNNTQSLYIEI